MAGLGGYFLGRTCGSPINTYLLKNGDVEVRTFGAGTTTQ